MEQSKTYQKLREIRKGKSDSENEAGFKKAVFGGYEPAAVEEYIKGLKNSLQLAEKTFAEKLEEVSSETDMLKKERESLNEKINSLEEDAEKLKKRELEITELEKAAGEERLELDKMRESLEALLEECERKQKESEDFELIAEENKKLRREVSGLTEQKDKAELTNGMLQEQISGLVKTADKQAKEIEELKKEANDLRLTNKNAEMSTNLKIFGFQQRQEMKLKNITGGINGILKLLDDMSENLDDFIKKEN
ncbi:MAG: hypothetical protein Q8878_05750 [Bacillota bacterium]|nr:hypothetical protein [Bacillota bacterium]